jgi:hypothetical protein
LTNQFQNIGGKKASLIFNDNQFNCATSHYGILAGSLTYPLDIFNTIVLKDNIQGYIENGEHKYVSTYAKGMFFVDGSGETRDVTNGNCRFIIEGNMYRTEFRADYLSVDNTDVVAIKNVFNPVKINVFENIKTSVPMTTDDIIEGNNNFFVTQEQLDMINMLTDSPLILKGTISTNEEFPPLIDRVDGHLYVITNDVTDSVTEIEFKMGDEILWSEDTWHLLGNVPDLSSLVFEDEPITNELVKLNNTTNKVVYIGDFGQLDEGKGTYHKPYKTLLIANTNETNAEFIVLTPQNVTNLTINDGNFITGKKTATITGNLIFNTNTRLENITVNGTVYVNYGATITNTDITNIYGEGTIHINNHNGRMITIDNGHICSIFNTRLVMTDASSSYNLTYIGNELNVINCNLSGTGNGINTSSNIGKLFIYDSYLYYPYAKDALHVVDNPIGFVVITNTVIRGGIKTIGTPVHWSGNVLLNDGAETSFMCDNLIYNEGVKNWTVGMFVIKGQLLYYPLQNKLYRVLNSVKLDNTFPKDNPNLESIGDITASNMGDGEVIFKRLEAGVIELKTLKGSDNVEVTSSEDEINFNVKSEGVDHNKLINYNVTEHRVIDDNANDTTTLMSTSKINTLLSTKQNNLGFTAENTANKGQPSGYASLDSNSKIPVNQLPESFIEVTSVNTKKGNVVLTQDDILDGTNFAQYSKTEKTKLSGIQNNANNYIHPDNHDPSIIVQNHLNRFVTDDEKAAWNSKQASLGFIPENKANKGVIDGYASLDNEGKVPITQLPSSFNTVTSVNTKVGNVVLNQDDILEGVTNTQFSKANKTKLDGIDLTTKQDVLGFTPENITNKKTTLTDSPTDYPSTSVVTSHLMLKQDIAFRQQTITNDPTHYASTAALTTAFALKEDKTNKGQPLGYASLDDTGKIPETQLPLSATSVTSVNEKIGIIVLTQDDILEGDNNTQFSKENKTKLNNIEENANNYTHPITHPPTIIEQDSTNRFVSDAEKSSWNSKQSSITANVDYEVPLTFNQSIIREGNVVGFRLRDWYPSLYFVDSVVTYNGFFYRCIAEHSGSVFDESKWEKIAKDSFNVITTVVAYPPLTLGETFFTLPTPYDNINEVEFFIDGIPLAVNVDFIEDSNTPHTSIILNQPIVDIISNSTIYMRKIIGINNSTVFINDMTVSPITSYSSNKIETELNTLRNKGKWGAF